MGFVSAFKPDSELQLLNPSWFTSAETASKHSAKSTTRAEQPERALRVRASQLSTGNTIFGAVFAGSGKDSPAMQRASRASHAATSSLPVGSKLGGATSWRQRWRARVASEMRLS